MSVYFVKGKGWRYDFTHKAQRYTETWFKTKTEAKQAEARQKEELTNPKPVPETETDMAFLDLVNLRLDHVKAYKSEIYSEREAMAIFEQARQKSHTDSHTQMKKGRP